MLVDFPFLIDYIFFLETAVQGVLLKLDHVLDLVLSLNLRFQGNASFTVTLQSRENRELFYLHYITSDLLISAQVLYFIELV